MKVVMKKLIFVIDSLISGGAERVMAILANSLADSGYNVSIISKAQVPPFFDLNNNVRLLYPERKVNYKNRFTTLLTRGRLYLCILRLLRVEKPDIVIPFLTNTNGIVILICKILGIHVIASEHNNYRLNIKLFYVRLIKRRIYPMADFLTVLTERDRCEYYGHFMNNVVVMPNPLPFEPLEDFQIEDREKTVLAVGELIRWEQKGLDILIDIFKEVIKDHSDWRLIIAGNENDNDNHIKELIEKEELTKYITLSGEVKDMQGLMLKSSIFALPSRWEGLPMVLLEAMSQGMACIAFDCFSGPRDLLTDNYDGLLINDSDMNGFISGLKDLIENKDMRFRFGKNAVESSRKYLPENIVRKWHSLIETIEPV